LNSSSPLLEFFQGDQAVDGVGDPVLLDAGVGGALRPDLDLDGRALVVDLDVGVRAGGTGRGELRVVDHPPVIGIVGELLLLDEGEEGAVSRLVVEVEGQVEGDPGVAVAINGGREVVLGNRPAGRGGVVGAGGDRALHTDRGEDDEHQA
jgi:hypothetical protein